MLVNLCDYKQSVTLIANSGVQFLDFGLTPQDTASNGRFVRKTANGPLLRLDFDLVNGRYTVPGTNGGQPEVVKPETTIRCISPWRCWTASGFRFRSCASTRREPSLRGRITGLAFRCAGWIHPIRQAIRTASRSPLTARLQNTPRPPCPRLKTIF